MRLLFVNETTFEIKEEKDKELLELGILYECGEEHDLHLTPDYKWNSLAVEKILLAIAE